ncbi:hypothetical protein NQ315_011178 [Exocentrus adspersus]|uniref:AAA+ ATPase domain-containing protein n=1 Tax=Exocentrus adspersus TaxID=1586481 RepID=A0AAV8V695_9CUCU|nr:hypothetical protein NQ315_011178 [Exocentrus adspersus]
MGSKNINEQHVKYYEEYLEALKSHSKLQTDLKNMHEHQQNLLSDLKKLRQTQKLCKQFIVKTSQGPRYVVGCKKETVNKDSICEGTRVSLDLTTLTIMRTLPREVDPFVYSMSEESPGNINLLEKIGGLKNQVRELKEVIELPIKNPEIFKRVGITAPKGVLLYGPPGTGKTLLARNVAITLDVNFLKVVSSALIEKYIDEMDAIGGKRTSDSSSADREVQRTLLELLNQLDGFKHLDDVKVIMATNRPDILDPALLRPGRLDRKIEIPLPNDQARKEILKYTLMTCRKKKFDFDILGN